MCPGAGGLCAPLDESTQRRRWLQVVLLVFRENLWSTALGAIAGLGIAFLASKTLSTFLYNTSPRDPIVLILSVTSLTFIASSASLLPAVRAARIEPMRALRSE